MSLNQANLPPKQFQIETESKASSNNNLIKCRLCRVDRRKFICKSCLFSKGTSNDSERLQKASNESLQDKQLKLKNLTNAQKQLEVRFNAKFEKFIHLEDIRNAILKSRSRHETLNALIKEKRENIQKLQEIKKENHEKNRQQRIILPKYDLKVKKLGDYVAEAIDKCENLKRKNHEQMEELKNSRRTQIDRLVKFIFPLSQQMVKTSSVVGLQSRKASNESLQPETIDEIAEAMLATTRSWTHESLTDHTREFTIVAPSLPANGNYQEYCDWIQSNKEGSANSALAPAAPSEPGNVANNNAYRISAALTYIAQLVQALSFFLDVTLPHKVTVTNDFCTMGLNEQQFRKKVARLNLNVLALCYSQNISLRSVQPARTMENIFQLLDIRNVELGKTGPVLDTSQRSIDSIMQSFTDILEHEHSDTDDDDTMLQKDWENVASLPLAEITQMVPQHSVSMAGTIIGNVANSLSFWKWK